MFSIHPTKKVSSTLKLYVYAIPVLVTTCHGQQLRMLIGGYHSLGVVANSGDTHCGLASIQTNMVAIVTLQVHSIFTSTIIHKLVPSYMYSCQCCTCSNTLHALQYCKLISIIWNIIIYICTYKQHRCGGQLEFKALMCLVANIITVFYTKKMYTESINYYTKTLSTSPCASKSQKWEGSGT